MVEPLVEFAPLVRLSGYDSRLMPPAFAELLGQSPALVGLQRQLEQLVRRYSTARRMPPVLLLGETGTGKSLIARALHAEGPRGVNRSWTSTAPLFQTPSWRPSRSWARRSWSGAELLKR